MKTRHNVAYENDTTPSREIVERYREGFLQDDRGVTLALVHYRGCEEEFLFGKEYCASSDPTDRMVGAEILAQLGWGDQAFLAESIEILIPMLSDGNEDVIYAAAVALGHRKAESAIPALLKLADHPNPRVRYGVVYGLSCQEDRAAIHAMIKLAADVDHDVRNWAVFGLGTRIDSDSVEIRESLRNALKDADHEIRGEALVGLAIRNDDSIVQELIYEWRDEEVSILSLEAAEVTADPRVYHRLKGFAESLTLDDDPYFAEKLRKAIKACERKDGCDSD